MHPAERSDGRANREHLTWHRATRCSNSGCVEVAAHGDVVLVRDSKNREGPVLTYDRAEWRNFVEGVKAGEFDL